MNKEIIKKIKKLLSLATSSNENEAQAASAKATELLTKYNLDMQEVKYADLDYNEEVAYNGARRKTEHKFIQAILNEYFNVMVLTDRTGYRSSKIKIMGEPVNLEIAMYTFSFLEKAFKDCYKAYKKLNPGADRQSYLYGLYKGFCAQMEEAKRKAETAKGLVLVRDPGLVKAYNNKHPDARTTKQSVHAGDSAAQAAGYKAGKGLKVARAMASSGGNKGGMIAG